MPAQRKYNNKLKIIIMKTTGWVFTIIGILSFIGAASHGDNTFGPLFWIGLGITLIYFGTKKEETKSYSMQSSNQTISNSQVISPLQSQSKNISTQTEKKQKTFWESYKEQNPNKAHDLEILYGESFNNLSESDIKERIRSVERAANSQECEVSQLKANVHKYFDKTIPEIGGDALREFMIQIQQKDLTEGHVKNKNSFTTLCIKWLDQYVDEREKRLPVEFLFREKIRHTIIQGVEALNSMGNEYLDGINTYLYINNLQQKMKGADSLDAMDALLKTRGFSAYRIIDEEVNKALKEYCSMDMDKIGEQSKYDYDHFEDEIF